MPMLGLISWSEYAANWWTWWLGDVAGVLVGTPFILVWLREARPRLGYGGYAEALLVLVLLGSSGLVVFGGWGPLGAANYPLVFLFEALLVWSAVRLGRHGAATATLVASVLAVAGTVFGAGPFVGRTMHESLLLLQSFTAISSVVALALAVVLFDRRRAEEELRSLNEALQKQMAERSAAVEQWMKELSERRQLEADLQQNQERTELIIETVNEAYVKMDAAGIIAAWNPEAEKTFGWSPAEAIGRELAATIIPARHRQEYRQGLKQFLTTGEGRLVRRRLELTALHRDGHEFPVEIIIAPRRVGDTYVFNAFLQDVSARKKFEEALARSNSSLQQFAYAASHDLQEPTPCRGRFLSTPGRKVPRPI
jgi:PAS domain S-box-containing protein